MTDDDLLPDDPEGEEHEDGQDDERILKLAHADWKRASDHWRDNQDAYRLDVSFALESKQWDEGLARERKENGRPVLTINKLPPFVRQVVNDARQNKPSIKVLPQDSEADPKTAQIYSGLIRNIESTSDADVAYDTAIGCSASGGFGFFRVNLAYVDERSFDQDIVLERIANPLTVLPDPDTQAADSSDWNVCFVAERIEKDEFKRRYPDAEPIDFESQEWPSGWVDGEKVVLTEYWRREVEQKRLILLTNGQTVSEDEYDPESPDFVDGQTGLLAEPAGPARTIEETKVVQYIVTGHAVLERNEWAGRWIPIIPVYGEEVNSDGKRIFKSLIRDAKDAQVLYNVSRTAAGEATARAPLAPWLGEEGAFIDSQKWATANRENHAYLEYKKGVTPPQRVGMPATPMAHLQEALTASDEMKAIIGIYDAGIGARSNETSGRAIMARQKESDTATFHFVDNLARAIRCAGRIIIDLIPRVYAPGRILRILGEDGEPEIVRSGTPEQAQQAQAEQQAAMQAVYALGVGRYDLTVAVGPAFNTRREEAATQMMELIRSHPAIAEIVGDLLVKNLDWPGADEIADRLQQAMTARQQPPPQPGPQQQPAPVMDPAKMAKVQVDAQNAAREAAIKEQGVQIDRFNAETQRMRAVADITSPTRMRVPAPGDFRG